MKAIPNRSDAAPAEVEGAIEKASPTTPKDLVASADAANEPSSGGSLEGPRAGPVPSVADSPTGLSIVADARGAGGGDDLITEDDDLRPARPNPISRTVDEITRLLGEIDDAREELIARGIQNQTLAVLVEFAFHERTDGRETIVEAALASAREAYGPGTIDREELERRLEELTSLERDIAHVRRLARQQGLDIQVLNFLTQIIRKNPGDGGERALDTFFGYALCCGLPLAGVADVVQQVGGQPKSVLPDIDRASYEARRWPHLDLVRDAALGLCLGLGMIWLLV